MASRDSLEMRRLAAAQAVQVSRDDTPIAIRMRPLLSAGAVTSVTIISATSLVNITANGGTDTYAFATYTTIGSLVDAINSDGAFEAMVLDALRSDTTGSSALLPNSAITAGADANGVVCYNILVDTSVTDYMTTTLSLGRNFDSVKRGHRVTLKEIQYNVDISAAEANAVRVFVRTLGGSESQVYGIRSVDATLTTISWASGVGGITAPEGADVVVRVIDTTSITDNAANYVQVQGILE